VPPPPPSLDREGGEPGEEMKLEGKDGESEVRADVVK